MWRLLESQLKERREGIYSEASGSKQVPPRPTQAERTLSYMPPALTLVQQDIAWASPEPRCLCQAE